MAAADTAVGMAAGPVAPSSYSPARAKHAAAASSTSRFVPAVYHTQKWAHFLDRCLATRLDAVRFARFAPIQQRKHPVSPVVLADLCLRPPPKPRRKGGGGEGVRSVNGSSDGKTKPPSFQICDSYIDPRIPTYLQVLLQLGYVDVASVLRALYRYSTSQAARKEAEAAAATASMGSGDNQPKQKHGNPAGGGSGGIGEDAVMEDAGGTGDGAGDDYDKNNGQSSASAKAGGHTAVLWASSYNNEETIFYRISRAVRQDGAIVDRRLALIIASSLAKWMELFAAAAASFAATASAPMAADMAAAQSQAQVEMQSSRAAFVMLLLAVCENEVVLGALAQPFAKNVRKALSDSLANFIPSVSLDSSPITARLEHFRTETLASFEPAEKKKEDEPSDIHDLLESTVGLQNLVIPELPITNSRAGLYIYLNAILVGRPLVDDAAIFSYLHNRYQGDLQTTAIDLILASFDVLANAVFRAEGQTSAHLLRSYLINKVPLLLASLAASPLYPFDSQYCISEALSRVDTNAFPTMSSMFDDNQNATPFTDSVRQDFCFSCCLHGLIPEASIETLLGEITYQSLPAGGRYTKESLMQQCIGDTDQMIAFVGQLDNMDGNVGAVCQALVAVLGHLCRTRETSTLKVLCNQLVRKPLAFDVMLLFERPSAILYPLCQLLDNWRYDDDQGEYQPVYEEFGSALFLLLAFVHRYNLSIADLGIQWSSDSFVAKLLSTGHLGRTLAEISEQERENLGSWIRGLFDTDADGLSDELMSSCPPQQFYMLTPTLFQQLIQAVSAGALPENVLKGGIEYLVDTFLLPSLVTALTYLSDALRFERPPEQKAILRILQLILQPVSISSDATIMLSALLNVVAKPLEHALRTYQRQDPKSQDIDPLLKTLKENIPRSRRTGAAEHNELVNWASSTGHGSSSSSSGANGINEPGATRGGLYAAIRNTVQGFVQWSLHPGVNIMPTSYTHRQLLAGLSLLGAPRLLQLLLDEVQRQTEAGSGSVAYDVACALICAPDVTNEPSPETLYVLVDSNNEAGGGANGNNIDGNGGGPGPSSGSTVPNPTAVQRRLSLRQALMFKAEEWKKMMQRSRDPADAAMAECVVRLYRKVEAQMTPPPPPPPPPSHPAEADMTGGLAGLDVDDPAVAAAAAAAAAAGLDDSAMDMVAAAAAASGTGDVMALDGVDLEGLQNAGGDGSGGGVGTAGGGPDGGDGTAAGAGSAGDLGDLGDLSSLGGLGDLGDLGDLGGSGDGGLGDQNVFGDLDLLNSWIDLQ